MRNLRQNRCSEPSARSLSYQAKRSAARGHKRDFASATALVAAAGLLASAPAHAYLDPGSGSLLLQLILGGMAGVAVAGKLYWHRLLVFFGVRSTEQGGESETRQDDESAAE